MTVRIRRASAGDAQAIAELGRELNAHLGDPTGYFTHEAVRRDGFGADPQFSVLLAEQDGEPVGYALFHDGYETSYAARGLYLCDLYVKHGARRQGTGRALVAAVAQEARARGKVFVWWVSKPWNTEAQAFYQTLGAIEEPVIAHALVTEAFDRMAKGTQE